MARLFIDPRDEAPALRRAAVLLARVRQDGRGQEPELEALLAGIVTMQEAAAEGRKLKRSAIDGMEAVLARVMPPVPCSRDASVIELLRCNALIETRDLLGRLAAPRTRGQRLVP